MGLLTAAGRLLAFASVVIAPCIGLSSPAFASPAPGCASPERKVREEGFVRLGGIEQWVTVTGERCGNPVILVLHGGPGNTLSPFAGTIYGAWEKSFTLVQWDQRGAGMTYGRSRPKEGEALTLEQMTADGIALAEHLVRRFGQRKVILLGGSWGSILGVHLAKARPDLFHAYVGVSQYVASRENEAASYAKVLALARASDDGKATAGLETIGPPPWTNPRHFGVLRRAVRTFERKVTDPAPASYWVPAPAYATPQAQEAYSEGEDYSFLQFVGPKGDGMASRVDLPALGMAFGIPVFLIHGAEDLLTTPDVARRYYDGIEAPAKAFVLVPRTGHDPNAALVEAEFRVMTERVRPLLK